MVQVILDDFYKNRNVPENVKIKANVESLEDMEEGSFEIFNGGEDYRNVDDVALSEEEKESLDKRLVEYRKEMQAFAEFLKDKFFSEGKNYIKDKSDRAQGKIDQERTQRQDARRGVHRDHQ